LFLLLFFETGTYRPPINTIADGPHLMRDVLVFMDSKHCLETGPNAFDPTWMSGDERIGEICAILGRGLVRLKARQSRPISDDHGESCLDFPLRQRRSGPVANPTDETTP
jgi:hypothetical protein